MHFHYKSFTQYLLGVVPSFMSSFLCSSLNQETKNRYLFDAVNAGDVKSVQVLMAAGANIEAHSNEDPLHLSFGMHFTPLMLAARLGHTAIVDLFIKAGAIIESTTSPNHTPLMLAIRYKHHSIVHLLVQAGANVDVSNQAVFLEYSWEHHLLSATMAFNPQSVGTDGDSPLMLATTHADADTAVLLLQASKSAEKIDADIARQPAIRSVKERAIRENQKNILLIFKSMFSSTQNQIGFLDLPVLIIAKILSYVLPKWYVSHIPNDIEKIPCLQERLFLRAQFRIQAIQSSSVPVLFSSKRKGEEKPEVSVQEHKKLKIN